MKKFLVVAAFLACASAGRAAQTYTIVKSSFTHDAGQGTFVVASSTYGAIVGIRYVVSLLDTVTSKTCTATVEQAINTPRLSFPTATAIKNGIQQDITDSGVKNVLLKCVQEQNVPTSIRISGVATNVSGVDGATVTPP